MNTAFAKRIIVLLFTVCTAVLLCVPAAPCFQVYADDAVLSAITEYPSPAADTVLKKGDKGQEVCWVQEALNRVCNAGLTVDGDFGKKTETVLRKFQTEHGLTVSGKADAETVQALQEILSPPAETQQGETETAQESGENEEPLLVLDPKPHSGVLLKSYWSAYFRCAKLCVTHLPAFFKMLYNGAKVLVIVLAALLIMTVIFGFTMGGWKNADAGPGMVYKHLYDYSISEATGCVGLGFWLVTRLLLLGVIISPLIADCWYISTYYNRTGSVCFGLALMFTLVRILAAFIIFKIGKRILTPLLYFLGMLLAYPFRLLRDKIKKVKTVKPSDLIPRKEKTEPAEITACVMLGICLAYMLFMPDIMAFIVK